MSAPSPHDHFLAVEAKDGSRFTWNVLPTTHIEAQRMAIPLACVYTPNKHIPTLTTQPTAPVVCKNQTCGCILNPYCRVDFINKLWQCPLCQNRNHFPTGYSLNSREPPREILPVNTTTEYTLDPNPCPPTFLFVIDLCNAEEELESLRDTITQNLMLMPEDSYIGLISFGKNIHVHQLRSDENPHFVVLNGAKEYKNTDIPKLLGIKSGITVQPTKANPNPPPPDFDPENKFLVPLAEFELTITSHLEQLRPDCWPKQRGHRYTRSVGTYLSFSLFLSLFK